MSGFKHPSGPLNGYNRVASYMGAFPTLAIFRRFLSLNAKNLLCMQAEIINHEYGLQRTIKKDRESKDPIRIQFEYDISALKGPHENPSDSLQWKRTLELRKLLKDYSVSSQSIPLPPTKVFKLTPSNT